MPPGHGSNVGDPPGTVKESIHRPAAFTASQIRGKTSRIALQATCCPGSGFLPPGPEVFAAARETLRAHGSRFDRDDAAADPLVTRRVAYDARWPDAAALELRVIHTPAATNPLRACGARLRACAIRCGRGTRDHDGLRAAERPQGARHIGCLATWPWRRSSPRALPTALTWHSSPSPPMLPSVPASSVRSLRRARRRGVCRAPHHHDRNVVHDGPVTGLMAASSAARRSA